MKVTMDNNQEDPSSTEEVAVPNADIVGPTEPMESTESAKENRWDRQTKMTTANSSENWPWQAHSMEESTLTGDKL